MTVQTAQALEHAAVSDFDEFIYVLSHDLRASVRALKEVPQWIGEDLRSEGHEISASMGDNLSMMGTHAHRLDHMLRDLLTYSRVGRMQPIEAVSLSAALDAAIAECPLPDGFEVRQDFTHNQIHMGTKDIVVLMKAFLSNAIKHNDKEEGVFEVWSKRDGAEITLGFLDNGPGIARDYQAKVFDVMSTLRPRDEVEGSGMGLALAKKIASYYGGTIALEDRGEGASFTLRLPL